MYIVERGLEKESRERLLLTIVTLPEWFFQAPCEGSPSCFSNPFFPPLLPGFLGRPQACPGRGKTRALPWSAAGVPRSWEDQGTALVGCRRALVVGRPGHCLGWAPGQPCPSRGKTRALLWSAAGVPRSLKFITKNNEWQPSSHFYSDFIQNRNELQ